MKNPSALRRSGFTLIELLVVITIIAVLAGAGFAVGSSAIQKAKKTSALASITAIESAVNQFYSEYGTLPIPAATTDASVIESTNVRVLEALLGKSGNDLNPRGIKFLSAKDGKQKGDDGTDGLVYDADGTTLRGLYDPWGGTYKIRFDADYDDQITDVKTSASKAVTLNGKKCAVWTDGADPTKLTDAVKSWQN